MTQNPQPQAEIITPAEAQFWQDWANKAPALIRAKVSENIDPVDGRVNNFKMLSFGLGALLGAASFTKYIPGKWKIASGAGTAGALAFGAFAGQISGGIQHSKAHFMSYADTLEQNPALKQQLANYLSNNVTAAQAADIDMAVFSKAMQFGLQNKLLQIDEQGRPVLGR